MKMVLLPQIIYLCIVYSVGSNQKDDNGRGTWEITSIVMEKEEGIVGMSRHRNDTSSTVRPHEPPLEGRKKAGIHAGSVGGDDFVHSHGTKVAGVPTSMCGPRSDRQH